MWPVIKSCGSVFILPMTSQWRIPRGDANTGMRAPLRLDPFNLPHVNTGSIPNASTDRVCRLAHRPPVQCDFILLLIFAIKKEL